MQKIFQPPHCFYPFSPSVPSAVPMLFAGVMPYDIFKDITHHAKENIRRHPAIHETANTISYIQNTDCILTPICYYNPAGIFALILSGIFI